MSVTSTLAVIVRVVATGCHVAAQIASDITWGVRQERRVPDLATLLGRLVRLVRWTLAGAVDPRTFYSSDGDDKGRRRKDLDRAARRTRRLQADLRRRHAHMLLQALGHTPLAVDATLTRHWQVYGGEHAMCLIEDYLATRMRWRDHLSWGQIDINRWASSIGGVWVPTPAPVRRYLRHAHLHVQRLDLAYTRQPRRGVRPAPTSPAALCSTLSAEGARIRAAA
jgi:hypothetical protein